MQPPVALFLLCSTALLAGDAPSSALPTACGPDRVQFSVKSVGPETSDTQPEPGKALVYVMEEFDRAANQLGKPTVRVGLDGNWVGAARGTSHISFMVEPGEHHFCVDWQSRPRSLPLLSVAASSLTAEAGHTYFFRVRIVEQHTLDLRFRAG